MTSMWIVVFNRNSLYALPHCGLKLQSCVVTSAPPHESFFLEHFEMTHDFRYCEKELTLRELREKAAHYRVWCLGAFGKYFSNEKLTFGYEGEEFGNSLRRSRNDIPVSRQSDPEIHLFHFFEGRNIRLQTFVPSRSNVWALTECV